MGSGGDRVSSMMMPLVMGLDDAAATPATVGGKGSSLTRLARAGFPVPPGFHVTTRAYEVFAAQAGLTGRLGAALAPVDPGDPATAEAAARAIGEVLAGTPVPEQIAAAVTAAYGELRVGGPAVAV